MTVIICILGESTEFLLKTEFVLWLLGSRLGGLLAGSVKTRVKAGLPSWL